MADYNNPTSELTIGTAGDDTFTITDRGGPDGRTVEGAGGYDRLIVDRSFDTGSSIAINSVNTAQGLMGRVNATGSYDVGFLIFQTFESVKFTGTAGDDDAGVTLDWLAGPTEIDLDGGAGMDRLALNLSRLTAALHFVANGSTITTNFGRFISFERFAINGGAGDDEIRTGDGEDYLSSGGGNDTLDSGGGNDVLVGHWGNAAMYGGAGDDIYYVDSSSDVISEPANGGVDSVYSTAGSYTLTANVENLYINPGTLPGNGTGNAVDNVIIGNSGDNILRGLGGDDLIVGDVAFYPGDGSDIIEGGDGNDRLVSSRLSTSAGNIPAPDGGTEKDIVSGGAGDDEVWVGINDEVDGGSGTDTLNLALSTLGAGVTLTTDDLFGATPLNLGTGRIVNFEVLASLYGTEFDDVIDLTGQSSPVRIDAGSGADRLTGGSGDAVRQFRQRRHPRCRGRR